MKKHFYDVVMPIVRVEPGKTASVSAVAVTHFFPEYLAIPEVGSKNFRVIDILSNGKPQIKGAFGKKIKPLPAAIFSDDNFRVALKLDSVKLGEKLTVVIKNVSRRPQEFRSCFKGYAKRKVAA